MSKTLYTSSIKSFWRSIVMFALIGLLLGVGLSFLRPFQYSSTARLLILQQIGAVDAYTASRAAERVAEDLANVVYTSTLFEKVISASSQIDASYFPEDERKARKKWEKTVGVTVRRGTGFLQVSTYHPDVRQAELLTRAISTVLVSEGWTYTSGGSISIQLVDDPVNSRWPVRPNVPLNAFTGLVLGGILGTLYVILKGERIRRRHQLVHK